MISFKVKSKEEARTISKIAHRAVSLAVSAGINYPFLDADMDITACHVNGCPLKLDELLAADEFNFAHDVFGIRRHINRKTGQLEDCFVPRFAQPDADDDGPYDPTRAGGLFEPLESAES